MSRNEGQKCGLRPGFTPLGIWAFSIGTSIGWGSFIVTCNTYLQKSGILGTVFGLLLGMAVVFVIAWNLQYMIRKAPDAGGIYSFEKQTGGRDLGFLAFWFILITYLAILWANMTSLPLFARFFLGDTFRFGFSYTLFGKEVRLGEALLSICSVGLIALLCANSSFHGFSLPTEGTEFFSKTRKYSRSLVCLEDLNRFMSAFTKENILKEIERNGIFTLTYRLLLQGKPSYIQLKAAMIEEKEGSRLIIGINDIDVQIRQEEEYARRLAQAQTQATVDALTGIKNKHSYLGAEEKLNSLIAERSQPPFTVSVLDVNDLKKINDTEGHQAGDRYLREACMIVCKTFRHSPVFRIGGDEFAVISQGEDYERIDELVDIIARHNEEALRPGGIVIACGMSKYDGDACVASVFGRADQLMYDNKNALKSSAE